MLAAPFKVLVDANVLYPFTLRDTLLRAAAAGYFQLYWSEPILDETTRNLVVNGVMTEAQAEHLQTAMVRAFPEAMVTDFESLVLAMQNDKKDRHVAAAALKVGAQVIVTSNMKDFRALPDGIEAQRAPRSRQERSNLRGECFGISWVADRVTVGPHDERVQVNTKVVLRLLEHHLKHRLDVTAGSPYPLHGAV